MPTAGVARGRLISRRVHVGQATSSFVELGVQLLELFKHGGPGYRRVRDPTKDAVSR